MTQPMYQSSFPLSHVYIILHMLGPRASRFRANLISLAWQSSSTLCETENIFANEVCSLNYTPQSFPSKLFLQTRTRSHTQEAKSTSGVAMRRKRVE